MSEPTAAAVVAGARGAVGAKVAEALRERGMLTVSTWFRSDRRAGDAVGGDRPVRFSAGDPLTADEVAAAVAATGLPLAALVWAVGMPSSKRPLAETDPEECLELFTVNAAGLVALWRALAPTARQAGTRVVVVSSQAARTVSAGSGPYSASKAALEAFALTLAKEEARFGVRVNVLSPSLIASPQAEQILASKGVADPVEHYRTLPWGRALSTDEVAAAVAALACDPAWDYVSGQVVPLAADIAPTPAIHREHR